MGQGTRPRAWTTPSSTPSTTRPLRLSRRTGTPITPEEEARHKAPLVVVEDEKEEEPKTPKPKTKPKTKPTPKNKTTPGATAKTQQGGTPKTATAKPAAPPPAGKPPAGMPAGKPPGAQPANTPVTPAKPAAPAPATPATKPPQPGAKTQQKTDSAAPKMDTTPARQPSPVSPLARKKNLATRTTAKPATGTTTNKVQETPKKDGGDKPPPQTAPEKKRLPIKTPRRGESLFRHVFSAQKATAKPPPPSQARRNAVAITNPRMASIPRPPPSPTSSSGRRRWLGPPLSNPRFGGVERLLPKKRTRPTSDDLFYGKLRQGFGPGFFPDLAEKNARKKAHKRRKVTDFDDVGINSESEKKDAKGAYEALDPHGRLQPYMGRFP
ncbi:hypothetical protein B0H63DRAFT_290787 [Podospora didyma]|uniref:Uncharacterized protein n=1 Tax=Podospora didyma TaxID=330526 RepID=A0AAE0N6T1_9PEZI|nr:hypothetical protein B0H63DRAFT_290787 [Podospora didyma]